MVKANESKSTDSRKQRICPRKKQHICMGWGRWEMQLERSIEVVLWTVRQRQSGLKSVNKRFHNKKVN